MPMVKYQKNIIRKSLEQLIACNKILSTVAGILRKTELLE